jgi:branched-chain amino acid transport system permease protein
MYAVYPYFGGSFTLLAFVIVVLGGMGNMVGGLLASFVIGLVTMVVSSLTSAEVGAIAAYAVFLLAILVRPQGLLGAKVRA